MEIEYREIKTRKSGREALKRYRAKNLQVNVVLPLEVAELPKAEGKSNARYFSELILWALKEKGLYDGGAADE